MFPPNVYNEVSTSLVTHIWRRCYPHKHQELATWTPTPTHLRTQRLSREHEGVCAESETYGGGKLAGPRRVGFEWQCGRRGHCWDGGESFKRDKFLEIFRDSRDMRGWVGVQEAWWGVSLHCMKDTFGVGFYLYYEYHLLFPSLILLALGYFIISLSPMVAYWPRIVLRSFDWSILCSVP